MTVHTNRANHQILDVARALLALHIKDRSYRYMYVSKHSAQSSSIPREGRLHNTLGT